MRNGKRKLTYIDIMTCKNLIVLLESSLPLCTCRIMAINLPPWRDDTGSIQLDMYTVYILKSEHYDRYYIGSTKNLEERITRHNQGRSKWTKQYRPWQIIYTEYHEDKETALKREKQKKSYKSGEAFKKLIHNRKQ